MKKFYIICFVLLFALAAIGPASAHWSSTVKVKEKLTTGAWQVGMRGLEERMLELNGEEGVQGCAATLQGRDKFLLDRDAYGDSIYIEAWGQKGSSSSLVLEIANCGTIPAVLRELECSAPLADNIGNWTVTYPKKQNQRTGTGLASLQKVLKDRPLDPEKKILIEMQFDFIDEEQVSVEGSFDLIYRPWNQSS